MPINVTVNGNPTSISKGKMVTYNQTSEFDQRRKIRLQQVRQQSKEIAADVLHRVRKEKEKQLSNVEQLTEKDLRRYQAKKLHILQKHYDECTDEMGAAYKNATSEKDPAEVLNEIAKNNNRNAQIRGKIASEKKTNIETKRQNEIEQLEQHRKFSKNIEKTRANLVAQIKQQQCEPKIKNSSKKRKKQAKLRKPESDIDEVIFNSDVENISTSPTKQKQYSLKKEKKKINFKNSKEHNFVDKHSPKSGIKSPEKEQKSSVPLESIKSHHSGQKQSSDTSKQTPLNHCTNQDCSIEQIPTLDIDSNICFSPLPHDRSILYPATPPKSCLSPLCSTLSSEGELSQEKIKRIIDDHRPIDTYQPIHFYQTTKISDRIRRRDQLLNHDFDINDDVCEPKKLQMENIQIVNIPSANEKFLIPSRDVSETKTAPSALPYVPKTSVKSDVAKLKLPQKQLTKVSCCDNSNRCTTKPVVSVPAPLIQRNDKASINVDTTSEIIENADFYENMHKQDRIAKMRGTKAFKKAQIQKDYNKLMVELPALQRQERLAAIRDHNPEFHMTDERLNELERRRQNKIENIFEKYYYKSKTLETPIITIRPIQKPVPNDEMKLPFTALDVSEELQPLNVGHWKSEDQMQTQHSSKISDTRQSQYSYQNNGSSLLENKVEFVNSKPELELKFSECQQTATTRDINSECKQKCIAELLQRLNKQRELLLQEVQHLPPSSNLAKILHDETLLHITDDASNVTVKNKLVSTATSPVAEFIEPKKGKTKKDVIKKRQGAALSSDSASDEKQKKRLVHKEKKQKIIKNEATQTSPKISMRTGTGKTSTATKDAMEPRNDIAHKEPEKLCEIIIKMSDESKVKISTQSISLNECEQKILKNENIQQKHDISSSTSYMSPPLMMYTKPNSKNPNENIRSNYKDILYSKPKQTNIDTCSRCDHHQHKEENTKLHSKSIPKQKNSKANTLNPQLLNYIKKLLSMSRRSIDDLTISSISDVSSPGPNIVDTQENSPFIQLQNVMNYYNLSFNDIQNQLIDSKKSVSPKNQVNSKQSDNDNSNNSSSNNNNNNNNNNNDDDAENQQTSDEIDYSEILSKYQEVTRNCVHKISTLTLMIDKLRSEKDYMLSPISVDMNENSTSYLELPSQRNLKNLKCDYNNQSGSSNKSSLTQDEVDRYLLEIGSPKKDQCQTDCSNNNECEKHETFIPMLQGIPKYNNDSNVKQYPNSKPKPPASLAQNVHRYNLNIDMTPHELSTITELDTGITSRNFSDLIQRSKTPDDHIPIRESNKVQHNNEETSSSKSGFVTISPEKYSPTDQKKLIKNNKSKSPHSYKLKIASNHLIQQQKNAEDITRHPELHLSGLQHLSPVSDQSSSSPENMEDILRTMGLGWAVSTLKKTQEALALSSSSSSVETSIRKQVSFKETFSSSPSDISLKDVLNREFFKKLSSTSLSHSSSDNSPHFQELQDISDILGTGTQNKDRSTQRTSTPVHQSKSTESKNNLFASVSDISSVRQHSDENMFLSIPNVSLDTNRSLNKDSK